MPTAPDLLLRDIHQPAAPPLWPPAPGWWIVAALLVLAGLALAWRWHRRRLHRRASERLFDAAMAEAGDGPAQIAAMSALLRRAARRHRADADQLEGEDWLKALDAGANPPLFQSAHGRLLLAGAWRPAVDASDLDALRAVARMRFLDWMGAAR